MKRHSYRLDVKKLDEAGFLSHRDLIRITERLLTKTGLPIHTSGGHKWPSPKISVLHPLPVGVESRHEVITFHLRRFFYPSEVRKRMDPINFPGLDLVDLASLSDGSSLRIREMSFRISFDGSFPAGVSSSSDPIRDLSTEEDASGEHVPENARDVRVDENRLTYSTTSSGGFLHPKRFLHWLQTHVDAPLPPVQELLKTDMILER